MKFRKIIFLTILLLSSMKVFGQVEKSPEYSINISKLEKHNLKKLSTETFNNIKVDTSGITDIGFDGNYPKYPNNPILNLGTAGKFDVDAVLDPSVVKISDSSYVMIYVGTGAFYSPRLGRAISKDGLSWSKTDSVFSPQSNGGSGLKDRYQWEGRTIYENDTLKMWYQAADTTNYIFQTFYAYSLDTGKTWTRHSNNPVFGVDAGNSGWSTNYSGFRSVIKKDGSYYAFYEGRETENDNFRIGSAVSPDGITWTNLNPSAPVIENSESWNLGQSLLPTVFLQGNKFVCFYSINNADSTKTGKTGYAVSYDGVSWYRQANNPVTNLRSSHGEWDKGFFVAVMNFVKTSAINNNYILYYRAGAHDGGGLFKLGAIILNEGPLPVDLNSFNVIVKARNVELYWSTVSETNNSNFLIERKLTSSNIWERVGNVIGSGNSNTLKNYSFINNRLNVGKYNYRLRQVDFNGNFQYHYLSSIVIIENPSSFSLSQNYPNPFNPSTKINFTLPRDSKVSLIIFDMSGREVTRILDNKYMKADYYTFEFNPINLSSGSYFYKIETEDYVQTKKMIFVK